MSTNMEVISRMVTTNLLVKVVGMNLVDLVEARGV